MRRFLLTSVTWGLSCLLHGSVLAQQAVVFSGGDALGAGGQVSYSIGEVFMTSAGNSNVVITAGVQQVLDIPPGGIRLSLRVFLAGPYDPQLGLMHDSLRVNQLIPLSEPYSAYPYLKPKLGLPAGEAMAPSMLLVSGQDAVVDWVYIELRAAQDPNQLVSTKRALLHRNGQVVDALDGDPSILFSGISPGQYYVSIKHRNHLGVMTATALTFSMQTQAVDFTTPAQVWVNSQIANPPRKQFGMVYALWPGDANYNKNIKYNGLQNDKEVVLGAVGGALHLNDILYGYRPEDVNMDHQIKYNGPDNDRLFILGQVGVSSPNTILRQHTPN